MQIDFPDVLNLGILNILEREGWRVIYVVDYGETSRNRAEQGVLVAGCVLVNDFIWQWFRPSFPKAEKGRKSMKTIEEYCDCMAQASKKDKDCTLSFSYQFNKPTIIDIHQKWKVSRNSIENIHNLHTLTLLHFYQLQSKICPCYGRKIPKEK